ncbi:hypothetical protein H5410_051634, partial [Solanum commersonii]
MKKLNAKEFGGIEDKIHKCIHQLELLQQDMGTPGQPQEKVKAENQAKQTLQKWLNVEEMDSNTTYFFANFKQRSAHNKVSMLTNADGVVVTHPTQIEEEVLSYYKTLLGSCVEQLPMVNPLVIKDGL